MASSAWTVAEVIAVLETLGYELKRHGSNHDIYDREGAPRPIPIPRHKGDLPSGTLRSIWRQAGITPDQAEGLR